MFNILGNRIIGASFLDLYAGAGGIGIEALSREAGLVVFVDSSRESLSVIKKNIEQTGFGERAQVVSAKAESYLKKPSGRYDIVFLDPPYAEDMQPLLDLLAGSGSIKSDGIVVAEHFRKQPSPAKAGALVLYREARYGNTVLAFYKMT